MGGCKMNYTIEWICSHSILYLVNVYLLDNYVANVAPIHRYTIIVYLGVAPSWPNRVQLLCCKELMVGNLSRGPLAILLILSQQTSTCSVLCCGYTWLSCAFKCIWCGHVPRSVHNIASDCSDVDVYVCRLQRCVLCWAMSYIKKVKPISQFRTFRQHQEFHIVMHHRLSILHS